MVGRELAAGVILFLSFSCATALAQTVKSKQSPTPHKPPMQVSQSLIRLMSNLNEWRSVDWTKPNVLDDPRWILQAKPEVENGSASTHEFDAPAFGFSEMKYLRWRSINSDVDTKLYIYAKVPAGQCPVLATAVGKELGPPITSDDTSRAYFSEASVMEFVKRQWQWTAGNTRIDARCLGSISLGKGESQTVFLAVSFQSTKDQAELKPAFLLRCSRTLKLMIASDISQLSDFVFWISQSTSPTIRDTQLVSIADRDSVQIDEFQIAFTLQNTETASTRYTIDRVSGQLLGEAKDKGKTFGKMTGSCVKAESPTKF